MSNPSVVSLHLVAGVSTGVSNRVTPVAAGQPVPINGSLASGGVATFDVARRVQIAVSTATPETFTLIGTDRYGNAQSETIAAVTNVNTVTSVNDYLTITAVISAQLTSGDVFVGTNSVASTPWVVDNFLARDWNLAVWVTAPSDGGTTYTVEETPDDPNKGPPSGSPAPFQFSPEASSFTPAVPWPNPTLVAQTQSGRTNWANQPIFAHRLTITGGTGKVTMQSIQSGITS